MGDGSLSQDEIDALLQGADDMQAAPAESTALDAGSRGGSISPVERDSLTDLFNSMMGTVADSLAGYLSGKEMKITSAVVEVMPREQVSGDFTRKYVQLALDFSGGFNGGNLIVFNFEDAEIISSLMMGDETGAKPEELTEAHQSTLQEFVNQMMSSMATGLNNKFGKPVSVSPVSLSIVESVSDLQLPSGTELVKVTYNLNLEGLVNSKFYHIMESPLGSDLAKNSMSASGISQQVMPAQDAGGGAQAGQVGINAVQFPPLGDSVPYGAGGNISLLLDVPLTLTVELGRTRQLVRDVLGLGEGSIIELDKLAGEPVDLLVNGKLIAKGEVVVIDENFGVRVTDIVSPAERLNKAQ